MYTGLKFIVEQGIDGAMSLHQVFPSEGIGNNGYSLKKLSVTYMSNVERLQLQLTGSEFLCQYFLSWLRGEREDGIH
jgi:hypothetical protein